MLSLERGIYVHSFCVCVCALWGFPDSSKARLKTCALTVAGPDRDGVGRNISLAEPPGLCKCSSITNYLQAQNVPPTEASSNKRRPQTIKIFTKNTGYNLTLAGPVSGNESAAAASKGVECC